MDNDTGCLVSGVEREASRKEVTKVRTYPFGEKFSPSTEEQGSDAKARWPPGGAPPAPPLGNPCGPK